MTGSKTLLRSMLNVLVQEWGHKEVEFVLSQISHSSDTGYNYIKNNNIESKNLSVPKKNKYKSRLLAVEILEKAHIEEKQKMYLKEIAEKFDQKLFLPRSSDVREFLTMMGQQQATVKDRADAFRSILKTLVGISQERLEQISKSSRHVGPSQLGPLSDAISTASTSLPRYRDPDNL